MCFSFCRLRSLPAARESLDMLLRFWILLQYYNQIPRKEEGRHISSPRKIFCGLSSPSCTLPPICPASSSICKCACRLLYQLGQCEAKECVAYVAGYTAISAQIPRELWAPAWGNQRQHWRCVAIEHDCKTGTYQTLPLNNRQRECVIELEVDEKGELEQKCAGSFRSRRKPRIAREHPAQRSINLSWKLTSRNSLSSLPLQTVSG